MEQAVSKIKNLFYAIDPRLFVLLNHSILIVVGTLFLELRRTEEQIIFAILIAVVTELILSKITEKQKAFNVKDRVFSAVVLALGALILIRSSYWWFYGLIAFAGVISKYILVNHQGRHIYNPTNVAIVFALLFLPEYLQVRPDSFSTHFVALACILFFGFMAVIRANSWRIVAGYYLGVLFLGILASYILDLPWLLILGPEVNTSVIIFAFLMITDPQTSPRNNFMQWIFGFAIAAVNLFLRYEELYYSQFMSLFIVISFWIVFQSFVERSKTLAPKMAETPKK